MYIILFKLKIKFGGDRPCKRGREDPARDPIFTSNFVLVLVLSFYSTYRSILIIIVLK